MMSTPIGASLALLHRGLAQSAGSSGKGRFSNDWTIFFQWLEKQLNYPMIGKIFRRFSNDWKRVSGRAKSPARGLCREGIIAACFFAATVFDLAAL